MSAHVFLICDDARTAPKAFECAAAALRRGPQAPDAVVATVRQLFDRLMDSAVRNEALVVVTSATVGEPLNVARTVAAQHPYAFFVFVVSGEAEAALRHEMVYGAPPGGRWAILGADSPDLAAQIRASLRAATQQKRFRSTVGRIALQLAKTTQVEEPEYRRLVASDHYLANLLHYAHDAIVSVTPVGEVISWNGAAETMLAASAAVAISRPLREFFINPHIVDEALRLVISGETVRRDLCSGLEADPRVADAIFAAIVREDEIVTGVAVIMRDVTEQRRLEAQARVADRRKDEFLAMLAHELRNPLAPIRNAGEMLRMLGGEDERIRQAGELISRQAEHMSSLLGDLLDVSRVTRGLIQLDMKAISPATFIQRAVEQVRELVDRKRQRLTITSGPDLGLIRGDADRLTQIAANLLDNAAKYTPDGGHIDVTVVANDAAIRMTIADDGMGIDAQLLPSIFELFTQAARSLDRANGGLGIGLALVRNLVELHGGSVFAESGGTGRGSAFTATFPRYRTTTADERGSGGTPAAVPSVPHRHILIVDDNEDAAVSLKIIMEMEGHSVTIAYSGASALDQAGKDQYDVFILDIGMPDMDGFSLASRLRSLPGCQEALMIAHTGYGQPEDRARSREAGFDHHLTKPANPRDILQLIAQR
ncbi:ATP-binding protein [Paraburkholderia sp. IW21]|uniref:hybrid sensor histidine kinase/response regulator n=1 Tax=Paraburkholderia sp. IW21 TaxID=3242488 RepID=UPI00351FCCF6